MESGFSGKQMKVDQKEDATTNLLMVAAVEVLISINGVTVTVLSVDENLKLILIFL